MTLRRANLSLPAAGEAHNGPLSLRIGGIRGDLRSVSWFSSCTDLTIDDGLQVTWMVDLSHQCYP